MSSESYSRRDIDDITRAYADASSRNDVTWEAFLRQELARRRSSASSASDIVTAASHATRGVEDECAALRQELAESRKERGQLIAAYTAQIQNIHQEHINDASKRKDSSEGVEKQVQLLSGEVKRKDGIIDSLTAKCNALQSRQEDASRSAQVSRDAGFIALIHQGEEQLKKAQAEARERLMSEAFLHAQLLSYQETSIRSKYAISATGERASISAKRMRGQLWEKDKHILKLQGDLLTSQQLVSSAKSERDAQARLHQQQKAVLEEGVDAEKQRAMDASGRAVALEEILLEERAKQQDRGATAAQERERHTTQFDHLRKERDGILEQYKLLETKTNMLERQKKVVEISSKEASDASAAKDVKLAKLKTELEGLAETHKEQTERLNHNHGIQVQSLQTQLSDALVGQQHSVATIQQQHQAAIQTAVESETDLRNKIRMLEGSVSSLQQANDGLSQRISSVGSDHNTLSDRHQRAQSELTLLTAQREEDQETTRQDKQSIAALQEELARTREDKTHRDSSITALQNEVRLLTFSKNDNEAKYSNAVQQLNAATEAKAALLKEVSSVTARHVALEREMDDLRPQIDLSNNLKALAGKLSLKTQEAGELRETNKALTEALLVAEANFAASNTRLTHSIAESSSTSLMLDKSLKRLQTNTTLNHDQSTMKNILIQATNTLRRALEEQGGYDIATLPLAPSQSLELPYLEQVLIDHATMCAQHFKRTSTYGGISSNSGAVPSAMRTPMIYKQRD